MKIVIEGVDKLIKDLFNKAYEDLLECVETYKI